MAPRYYAGRFEIMLRSEGEPVAATAWFENCEARDSLGLCACAGGEGATPVEPAAVPDGFAADPYPDKISRAISWAIAGDGLLAKRVYRGQPIRISVPIAHPVHAPVA